MAQYVQCNMQVYLFWLLHVPSYVEQTVSVIIIVGKIWQNYAAYELRH